MMLSLSGQVPEIELKAVLIEKIVHFVNWPDSLQVKDTFDCAVFGQPSFVDRMIKIYSNRKFDNKDLKVTFLTSLDDLQGIDLVIIGSDSKHTPGEVYQKLKGKPILTLSESSSFGEEGIMINLKTKFDTLTFVVNYESAKQSGISISYHLLKSAQLVSLKK
jgi:hypothetical protein